MDFPPFFVHVYGSTAVVEINCKAPFSDSFSARRHFFGSSSSTRASP